jgi:hypothetical protein
MMNAKTGVDVFVKPPFLYRGPRPHPSPDLAYLRPLPASGVPTIVCMYICCLTLVDEYSFVIQPSQSK